MTYDVSKGGMPSGGGQPSLKETRTGQALNAVATAGGLHAAYLTGKEIHRAVKQGPVEAGKHAKPVKPGRAARVAQKIPAVGRTFKDPRKLAMASLGGWAALHTGELIGDAIAARALHRQAKQAKAAQAKPAQAKPQPVAKADSLPGCLQDLLSDVVSMYQQAQLAHWNVTGPHFAAMHAYFGDLYKDVYDSIDPIAENMRKIGVPVPAEALASRGMARGSDPQSLAALLMASNARVQQSLQEAFDCAEGNDGLQNFLADRLDAHAKHAWMLRSIVGREPAKESPVKKSDLDPRNGVGRRITEVSKADPADPAPAAKRPPLTRKAKGKLAAASLAATAGAYGLMKLGENRNTGDLAFGKARYFDPEADRQRRMGMYSGVLAGGGITAGSLAATRGSFRRVVEPAKEVRGKMRGARYGIKGNKFGYGAAAAAAGLGLAAGAVYNRGISRRNQPWT